MSFLVGSWRRTVRNIIACGPRVSDLHVVRHGDLAIPVPAHSTVPPSKRRRMRAREVRRRLGNKAHPCPLDDAGDPDKEMLTSGKSAGTELNVAEAVEF